MWAGPHFSSHGSFELQQSLVRRGVVYPPRPMPPTTTPENKPALRGRDGAGLRTEIPAPSLYDAAWIAYLRNRWTLLASSAVLTWLPAGAAYAAASLLQSGAASSRDVNLGAGAAAGLVFLVLLPGALRMRLDAARGEEPSNASFFSGLADAPALLVARALAALVIIPASALAVPGIWLAQRFMMAGYLIVDAGLGPIAALRESWRVTRGLGWAIFKFTFWGRIMLGARSSLFQASANRTGSTAVSGAVLYLYLTNRMPSDAGTMPVLAPPKPPPPRRSLPASAAPLSVCPRCGSALEKHEISGFALHACTDCGGAWMDNAASQRIVQSFEQSAVVAAHGLGREASKPVDTTELLECPVCHGALERVVPGGTKVEVDICREHGTWFDRHEIERVAHAGERARKAKAAAAVDAAEATAAAAEGGAARGGVGAAEVPPSLESSNTYVRGAKNIASSAVIAALGALLSDDDD